MNSRKRALGFFLFCFLLSSYKSIAVTEISGLTYLEKYTRFSGCRGGLGLHAGWSVLRANFPHILFAIFLIIPQLTLPKSLFCKLNTWLKLGTFDIRQCFVLHSKWSNLTWQNMIASTEGHLQPACNPSYCPSRALDTLWISWEELFLGHKYSQNLSYENSSLVVNLTTIFFPFFFFLREKFSIHIIKLQRPIT